MDDVAQTKLAGLLVKIEQRLSAIQYRNEALTVAVEVLLAHAPQPTVVRQALVMRSESAGVSDEVRREIRRVFAGSFATGDATRRSD